MNIVQFVIIQKLFRSLFVFYVSVYVISFWLLLLLLLLDSFQGVGAWRKTIELQTPGNFPMPGSEVLERQRVAKERAAQRVRCWTVQNWTRGVLGRVSAGAA